MLEKLPIIRGDLVRNDPDWETWGFVKLAEALRQWTRRNPIDNFKLEDTVIPETRPRVPNTAKKETKVCLMPSGRSQADRTQRISGIKKAQFQLHRSAQIIGMQKYHNLSTLW